MDAKIRFNLVTEKDQPPSDETLDYLQKYVDSHDDQSDWQETFRDWEIGTIRNQDVKWSGNQNYIRTFFNTI